MARNKNVLRDNGHHLVTGSSGCGKSSWLRSKDCPLIRYKYQIFWDPDEDHKAHRFTKKSEFAKYLKLAVQSGKPYKIALTLDDVTPENYEFFSQCVWAIADGKRDTAVIVEELADLTGQGKAGQFSGQVMRKGRKYGLDVFAVSQRPAEIDKTTYTQCVNRWCGYLDNEIDLKRMSGVMNTSLKELQDLQKLEYFYKTDGFREPKRNQVRFS